MKKVYLSNIDLEVPAVILGCMRMGDKDLSLVKDIVATSIDNGITFFDHADIYGRGNSEIVFGKAIKELNIPRDSIWIQSKASIRPDKKTYDFSKEHILSAVDGILERLGTDYLDSFLLHRPDTLMDLREIAETFDILFESKKVRYFGVSNFNVMQVEMIKKYMKQPLHFNQLQFGLMHTSMIDTGINVNIRNNASVSHDGSILEYSRLHDMTIQGWSPFLYGHFEGVFIDNEKFPEVNEMLDTLAKKYNVTNTAIATAWVLRHPANIQMIAGTMKPERIVEIARGADIELTREEWYALYLAAGNMLP